MFFFEFQLKFNSLFTPPPPSHLPPLSLHPIVHKEHPLTTIMKSTKQQTETSSKPVGETTPSDICINNGGSSSSSNHS